MPRGAAGDTHVVRPVHRPNADRTLVCLGFCGGGTGSYRAWAHVLGPDVDLALVCYPGREGRFAEPYAHDWAELIDDTTAAVRRAADRPYVLFGHSMGGWMAFDVVTGMAGRGDPLPGVVVLSACNAPDRGLTERDRFPSVDDTDAGLLEWMRIGGLLPDYVRDDPDLTEMAVELMRADVRIRDTYRYRPGVRTGLPVQVLHGVDDPVIDPDVATRWRAVCDGPLTVTPLPGGHFYTPEVWADLPRHIDSFAFDLTAHN
ncbi:thioesterase II family protein [Amycolatopsis sp. NPDC088138]|uniref:thioesterase II family protein n=1 Tax=Amycolatopsis sp. NPDC088138 TaxID=3363938 RepID=UPI0038130A5D